MNQFSCRTDGLAVMIWFHGGAFSVGMSRLTEGNKFSLIYDLNLL